MTLSPRPETIKTLFSHLLLVLIEAMERKMISLGSTTFTLPEHIRGTEPDDCFYERIFNAPMSFHHLIISHAS